MGRYNKQGSKKQIGQGLTLEKFADAKLSKYDKKNVLAKKVEEKLRRQAQYKKLRSKIESAGGLLSPILLADNVAQVEEDVISPQFRANISGTNNKKSKTLKRLRDEEAQWLGVSLDKESEPAGQQEPSAFGSKFMKSSNKLAGSLESRNDEALNQESAAEGPSKVDGPQPSSRITGANGCAYDPNGMSTQGREHLKHQFHGSANSGNADFREGTGKWNKGAHKQRPLTQLEKLSAQVQAEKEQKRDAFQQAQRLREEKRMKIIAAKRARYEEKHRVLMRTASGQPLMKFRLKKILDVLEKDVKNAF
ncbi:hypothetical protein CEUSTIGMA_g9209.t1 [Chlamydomonas eustigma]|uniref:Uncharacterized protein n=1 Tax=Chlamydomonas eustigma TaxID=1157962 RepID=A0A250XFC9_9CHLO|nr:hypothetical protein CEUSTIGMA_g9209.t1 [Chlamydomonas eustigma]|eukprot:GAX81781.1 hypothetical protein CEUSTIGMA_g9209.t1 [Chlamydomonas eustigma]